MSMTTRRSLVLGASALAIAAAFGLRLRSGAVQTVSSDEGDIRRLIEREFGGDIAASEEVTRFAFDVGRFMENAAAEEDVIFAFIRSTNVIRAIETGEPLVFLSVAPPLVAPCQNTLSAAWL